MDNGHAAYSQRRESPLKEGLAAIRFAQDARAGTRIDCHGAPGWQMVGARPAREALSGIYTAPTVTSLACLRILDFRTAHLTPVQLG
jgi:hypothetical protein